ncbi:hypothetical protein SAMN05720606_104106 [Paenibacillus polysaccharolyticus]|uniref:Uncharacterized protein n=1 Tax=Paenibacillus polysaccharolyticus TaxID=582692 RepID=A0A1G5F8P1_9BACL|nr:hypothetical protein [Paenibacillus polysaccharolyticus]SCY35563.1 hypothetical protein SAMN05720606_104106 [Paenibacillus polysaccharolyticus]
MSISSFIVFECKNSPSACNLLNSIRTLCTKVNMFFDSDDEKYDIEGELKYTRIYISDKPFKEDYVRTISFSVHDEPYDFQIVTFDWDNMKNEYFKAIVSDDFDGNEDLLFQFLFALLHEYSDAKVWMEEDWFYTFPDLERIKDSYNNSWCYIDPINI